jgi:c-di-GMP-binding flagellar brake protein YcgR
MLATIDKKSGDARLGQQSATGNTAPLSKVRLLPGDLVQLQTLSGSNTERYQVSVIGAHAPHSVLVSAPQVMGKLVFIKEGKQLLVRGFVGNDAVAYRTQVLKSLLSPYPYLHLSYPENVQSMRIRKSARVPVEIVAAVSTPSFELAARIVDLSCGGARLSSQQKLGEEGDEVTIKFRIYSGDQDIYLTIKALIRTCVPDDTLVGMYNCGIQFTNLENQQRLYLENQVYQRMLDENS